MKETDHDLLIKNGETLKKLCGSITELKGNNKEEHKDINNKLNNTIHNKLFYFFSAIMISCIIGLTAYVGTIKNEVVKNSTCIENIQKNIDNSKIGE